MVSLLLQNLSHTLICFVSASFSYEKQTCQFKEKDVNFCILFTCFKSNTFGGFYTTGRMLEKFDMLSESVNWLLFCQCVRCQSSADIVEVVRMQVMVKKI